MEEVAKRVCPAKNCTRRCALGSGMRLFLEGNMEEVDMISDSILRRSNLLRSPNDMSDGIKLYGVREPVSRADIYTLIHVHPQTDNTFFDSFCHVFMYVCIHVCIPSKNVELE